MNTRLNSMDFIKLAEFYKNEIADTFNIAVCTVQRSNNNVDFEVKYTVICNLIKSF